MSDLNDGFFMNDEGIYTSINFMEMYQIFIRIGQYIDKYICRDFGRTLNLCISHINGFRISNFCILILMCIKHVDLEEKIVF